MSMAAQMLRTARGAGGELAAWCLLERVASTSTGVQGVSRCPNERGCAEPLPNNAFAADFEKGAV